MLQEDMKLRKNYDEYIIEGKEEMKEDKDIWKIKSELRFRDQECIDKNTQICEELLMHQIKDEFKSFSL